MWISPKCLRAATKIYPQANVEEIPDFHRECELPKTCGIIHTKFLHIPQPLWNYFRVWQAGNIRYTLWAHSVTVHKALPLGEGDPEEGG